MPLKHKLMMAYLLMAGSSALGQPKPDETKLGHPEIVGARLGSLSYPRLAMDSQAGTVRLPGPGKRFVSLASNTDEYLYRIVPPQMVVGVSASAYNPQFSAVTAQLNQYHPVIARDFEVVRALKPDLVLTTDTSPHELVNALQDAGFPVFQLHTLTTQLAQVGENITVVGYLTGFDDRARIERSRFDRELADVAAQCKRGPGSTRQRARIYGVSMMGFGFGDQTLFHDVVRLVGGVNVAAERGMHAYDEIDNEDIARLNPDWVFAWSMPGEHDVELQRWRSNPTLSKISAVKTDRLFVHLARDIFVLSPMVTELAHIMADATCKP